MSDRTKRQVARDMPRAMGEFLNARAAMKWWHVLLLFALLIAAVVLVQVQGREDLRAYSDVNQAESLDRTLAGCERNGPGRIAAFSNSVLDAATREAAAKQYTAGVKADILLYADANWQDAQRIVDAAAEFPDPTWTGGDPTLELVEQLAAEHLDRPGSPTVICEQAFATP